MNWASPITVDEEAAESVQIEVLLRSSEGSWTQTDTTIQPDFALYPDAGFRVSQQRQSAVLAVSAQGVFESYFRGRPSPLDEPAEDEGPEGQAPEGPHPARIDVSPNTSRLVVLGSAEFVDDLVLEISSQLGADRYLNSLKLVQNAVAWATEDADLLSIRARGTSTRVLLPLTESGQAVWEAANYVVALLALVGVGALWAARRRREEPMILVQTEGADPASGEVSS
jgi:ABC-2 type transport system permease protein